MHTPKDFVLLLWAVGAAPKREPDIAPGILSWVSHPAGQPISHYVLFNNLAPCKAMMTGGERWRFV